MILPAQTIRRLGIITPCEPRTVYRGVTYGLGPAGYDLRIAQSVTLYPGESALVDAVEYFNMPDDVMGVLFTKSTWARKHIRIANTTIEPGWRGRLRIELDLRGIYSETLTIREGCGVAQVVFWRLEEATELPYQGKYQDQRAGQDAIFELPPGELVT